MGAFSFRLATVVLRTSQAFARHTVVHFFQGFSLVVEALCVREPLAATERLRSMLRLSLPLNRRVWSRALLTSLARDGGSAAAGTLEASFGAERTCYLKTLQPHAPAVPFWPHTRRLATKVVAVPLAQTGEGIAACELLSWSVKVGAAVAPRQRASTTARNGPPAQLLRSHVDHYNQLLMYE